MGVSAKIFYIKCDQLVETRRLVPLSTLGAMAAKAPRQFRQERTSFSLGLTAFTDLHRGATFWLSPCIAFRARLALLLVAPTRYRQTLFGSV